MLIKYFKNTKVICLKTQESFAEGPSTQKTPIAGNGCWTKLPDERNLVVSFVLGLCPFQMTYYLYKLMVGLWYMHMYASQRSLRAQPRILLESKECNSSRDIFKYSPTSGQGVTCGMLKPFSPPREKESSH